MKNNSDYEVGFGRPPKERRFKPGQSGNPSGRPKGVRSLKAELLEELRELVSVVDGPVTVEVSKARAVVKTLLRLAIGGDARAICTVMASSARALGEDDGEAESEAPEDRQIMEAVAGYQPERGGAVQASSLEKKDLP
jgi:hypothetical protein